jgi:hypothetical protein
MILEEYFLTFPLLITLIQVRMVWRFVQQKFMAFEDLVSSCLLEIDSFLGSYVDSY